MKFYEALAATLKDAGVDTMFGVIGDANLFMVDDYMRRGGAYVSAANESGAVAMATGFARITGDLGVATVTHGAISNTITALIDATRGHDPLLVITGDTAVEDKQHMQNLPQRDLVMPTGAGFEQLRSPRTLVADVHQALHRARTERRPIVLNIPVDFTWIGVDYQPRVPAVLDLAGIRPSDDALDRAVGLIASAQRPVVLAGRGARAIEAKSALLRLAERIGAPVATTLKGNGLFRGEFCDLGFFGNLSSSAATEVIAAADCIIAFGAGLNQMTTMRGELLAGKRVVHVDTDPGALELLTPVDVAVVGDAGATADVIVAWLDAAEVPPTGFRSDAMEQRLAADRGNLDDDRIDGTQVPGTVDNVEFLRALEVAVPAKRTLILDGGRFWFDSIRVLTAPAPGDYIHPLNIGSIGLAMSNAIGAAQAKPDRPALVIIGDGSFMLGGLQEFNTAVRHGSDVIVVIMNDGAYGAEHLQFRRREMDPAISFFSWPEFAAVAEALGGQGYTVRASADLDLLPKVIANRTAPLLIDVKLDPELIPHP
ncbi:thiamine pyrophosphate-binding protein [Nocardioides sp. DS6]|uniref:Thiamine pyrophosphate-binding protein n=1 Tax=Nocardioides eburneus TaxID=3231482 RepID=A0ABV3SYS3_9ACTN